MRFVIDVEYVHPDKDNPYEYIVEDITAALAHFDLQLVNIWRESVPLKGEVK